MFTFDVAHPSKVQFNFKGQLYEVERFLMPEVETYAAEHLDKQKQAILDQCPDANAKARAMAYFSPSPLDMGDLMGWLRTPSGVRYVLHKQLTKLSISAEDIDSMIAVNDPRQLLMFVDELTSAREARALLAAKTGETDNKVPTKSGSKDKKAGD